MVSRNDTGLVGRGIGEGAGSAVRPLAARCALIRQHPFARSGHFRTLASEVLDLWHATAMTHNLPRRGQIAIAFVEACHDALREQIDMSNDLFFAHYARKNEAFNEWVTQQPSRQRSYLRAVAATARGHAAVMYSNGLDHALLFKDVLDRPRNNIRIWSYLSLARGCVEAMMRITYLLDREVSPNVSLLRSAAVVLDGLQEQMKLARAFEDDTEDVAAKSQRALEAEVKRCERAGITFNRDLKKGNAIRSVSRDGVTINVMTDVTAESEKRLPEVPAPYRIGSAATHSGAWFLVGAVMTDEGYDPAADPDIILTALSMVLFGLLAVAAVESAPEEATEMRRLRLKTRRLWSVAFEIDHLAHPQ
jgi:hypothetical protein